MEIERRFIIGKERRDNREEKFFLAKNREILTLGQKVMDEGLQRQSSVVSFLRRKESSFSSLIKNDLCISMNSQLHALNYVSSSPLRRHDTWTTFNTLMFLFRSINLFQTVLCIKFTIDIAIIRFQLLLQCYLCICNTIQSRDTYNKRKMILLNV